jgi:thiol-disulfide isomerase/thioredoxin
MEKFIRLSLFLALLLMIPQLAGSAQATRWHQTSEDGSVVIDVYFFWSKKCPHCLEARPFIEQFTKDNPWIILHDFQVVGEPGNIRRYEQITSEIGATGNAVPAFLYCGQLTPGFDEELARSLSEDLLSCRDHVYSEGSIEGFSSSIVIPEEALVLSLPLVGEVEIGLSSLGLITVMLASVDSFNPCAFFVLMLLLSMMLHTGSRKKMLLVGGVFLFFSGFMYFLFMSAWLNLFMVLGRLDLLTMIAAVVAITIGGINIKDYFWFRKGVSIGISDDAKPGLYQRMRAMLRTDSLTTLLLATAGLHSLQTCTSFSVRQVSRCCSPEY